jgi:hypothetical protein
MPEKPETSLATPLPRGKPVHLSPVTLLSVEGCHRVYTISLERPR